jgi:dTDP-4-dehydrorhamnose reductase
MVAATEVSIDTMTWILFGAHGQLGRCLQDELDRQQIEYRAYGRSDVDVTNAMHVSQCIQSFRPSIVVNLAAWTDVDGAESHRDEAFAINASGAENVALACESAGAHLIHVSTDYVFDGTKRIPYLVDDITNPLSVYGASKLSGEKLVIAAHPSGTWTVRTAWLYSQYGKNFAKTILKRAMSGGSLSVVNDAWGQPTSAVDLATQLISLAKACPPAGVFHATNTGDATWCGFATELTTYVENPPVITPVTSDIFPTVAVRPTYSVLDHSCWVNIGLQPMQDWRTALLDTIDVVKQSVREEMKL